MGISNQFFFVCRVSILLTGNGPPESGSPTHNWHPLSIDTSILKLQTFKTFDVATFPTHAVMNSGMGMCMCQEHNGLAQVASKTITRVFRPIDLNTLIVQAVHDFVGRDMSRELLPCQYFCTTYVFALRVSKDQNRKGWF